MKKFIVKIMVFLGLMLLVLGLCEKHFIKENRFNLTKVVFDDLINDNHFNILFFGSSKSYCSYNPAVLHKELNINSYNLAGQGQVLEITKFAIKDALQKTTPDVIVVDISYNMIVFSEVDSIANPKKSYQFKVLDNFNFSLNKTKTLFSIYSPKEAVNAISPLIRNHKEWNSLTKKNFKKSYFEGKNNLFLGNNGYLGTLHEMSDEGKLMASSLKKEYDFLAQQNDLKLSSREIKVIEDLEKIAKSNNTELLFVSAPSIKARAKHASFYKNLETFFKSKNIKYLNLNRHFKDIGLISNDFKDSQHMNYNGGYKTSKFLSHKIDKMFSINKPKPLKSLKNTVSYQMLTSLENSSSILNNTFQFNNNVSVKKIRYFEEFKKHYAFLFQLDPKILQTKKAYRGYIRYYNGKISDQNKKVISFPLKTIKIENDIYTFARVNILNKDIKKLDIFFIEKGANKVSKTYTLRDLKIKKGIR